MLSISLSLSIPPYLSHSLFLYLYLSLSYSLLLLVCKEDSPEARSKVEADFTKAVASMRKVYAQAQVNAILFTVCPKSCVQIS